MAATSIYFSRPEDAKKRKLDVRSEAAAATSSPQATPPPEQSEPVRSASFFFDDGNVTLQAESTLYKVHRSLLAKAQVFADTLLVGSAGEGNAPRGQDGSIIRLDDRVGEFDVFLKLMYDGMSFAEERPTLSETRSLLLLADKYDHPTIFAWADRAFAARSSSEEAVQRKAAGISKSSYVRDEWLPPGAYITLGALISLSFDFQLDPSSVLWTYQFVAELIPDERAHVFDPTTSGVDGWQVQLSRASIYEIFRRSDQVSLLAHAAFRAIRKEGDFHDLSCAPNSPCHRAKVAQTIASDFGFVPASRTYETYLESSYAFAVSNVEDGEDPKCLELIRRWYKTHMDLLDKKRKEPLGFLPA